MAIIIKLRILKATAEYGAARHLPHGGLRGRTGHRQPLAAIPVTAALTGCDAGVRRMERSAASSAGRQPQQEAPIRHNRAGTGAVASTSAGLLAPGNSECGMNWPTPPAAATGRGCSASSTGHPDCANASRPGGRARCAPLHQAADVGAPARVANRRRARREVHGMIPAAPFATTGVKT